MYSKSMWLVVILVRLVTGLAAVCIGLGAIGVNVEEMLHLESLDMVIRVVVGLCGAYSLVGFLMQVCSSCGSSASCNKK